MQLYDQALAAARADAAEAVEGLEADREGAEAEARSRALRLDAVRIDEQVLGLGQARYNGSVLFLKSII